MSPGAAQAQATATCARTVTADVVAINQPYFFNRLGTVNPAGQIFALRGDVVDLNGTPLTQGGAAVPGEVRLRADKRPRPLVLRANAGDCLVINFENLLEPDRQRIQFDELPNLEIYDIGDNLPADRHAGIAVTGLSAVDHITNSGRAVGRNEDSTAAPGEMRTYKFYAAYDGAHLLYDSAVQWSGEGGGGSSGFGLFGAVNIQPAGAKYYRSKVSRVDLDLATTDYTAAGHPIINYDARYPEGHPRVGLPILNMLDGLNLVHSDLEAIIVGPIGDGSFPASAYLTSDNPSLPNRLEPYREFTSVWQDEPKSVQAFPGFFSDPVLGWTLESTKDSFLINYGSGGIGSEIIANRLGVGPMYDCLGCKYEDFFLSSFTVGDPAQIVDVPANAGLELLAPGQAPPAGTVGPKATRVLYPDDPSNVHHSYIGDFTKFRNVHVGHEHHIFHLHAHQWLYNANDDESTMLDSQAIGPGSAFTYEIAFGGAGNRNRTPGDAIYHCHFYPHFAMGMWAHWRNHDVMEMGTEMDGDGRPLPGSRAYPDGEIAAGTPIPAVIPLPGKPMPPMPGRVEVVPVFANGSPTPTSSVALVTDREVNPGFPFYVAGIEDAVGQRNTTPPLDILEDGGLRRHALLGFSAGGEAHVHTTRTDMTKEVERADVIYYDEGGTDLELVAMAFHAERAHDSFYPDGASALVANNSGFRTNGAPATRGAPFADPCVDDEGQSLTAADASSMQFFGGITYDSPFDAENPRVYRAADIQMDMVFNKAGWHFPQQRLRVLNEDVAATLNNQRPPEPMVLRLNSFDCAVFEHTNLIPYEYELDDYQVKTPTDIVSAHIHLVKFDVMASDGAGNGWNYESGSLSPQEVVERIVAIRAFNNCVGDHLGLGGDPLRDGGDECPVTRAHPYFSGVPGVGNMALGARTTVQRWFADPVVNRSGVDRTLGTVFFHDHYGPSTHQQTGLYSTVLVQPSRSEWRHNETGELLGNRPDGGPTSWQAAIIPGDGSPPHREFFLQFADFQHAYEAGGGVDNLGNPVPDFAGVINPPLRENANPTYPELVHIPATCPGDLPRPCPEAITKFDPGTYVVNYRNEPLGLRLYDPNRIGTDGRAGWVADGEAGDPALVMSSTVLRAIPELNTRLGNTPYPALTNDIADGDPFTPLIRTLAGDLVKLRVQTGSHEEEHNVTIHGLRWLQESASPDSGWRNSQIAGISEQFIFQSPVAPALGQAGPRADYAWVMNANIDGQWNGIWGLLRSYNQNRNDLYRLPTSSTPLNIRNRNQFTGVCPNNAPRRNYEVNAVRALDVLPPLMDANGNLVPGANPFGDDRGTLVYNSRSVGISALGDPLSGGGQRGPLHDPSALLYVLTEDLEVIPGNDCGVRDSACPVRLRADRTVEPLILRASAGECIDVRLVNRLPAELDDIPGVVTVPAIINRHIDEQGKTTFQSQMIRPSSHVGLHTQLVSYDVTRADGRNVGQNTVTTVPPGEAGTFRWYAGIISHVPAPGGRIDVVATPSEFGVVNIMPADPIKGPQKGLVGALVIQPQGSVWIEDPGTRASATVFRPDGTSFRDFVAIAQLGVNWLYADGTPVPGVNIEGAGVPADPKDSGHQAVNYRSEPLWYRYGIAPDVDFGDQIDVTEDHRLAFSNALIGGADPQTPVFQATAGTPVRLRLANPGGNSRNWVFEVTGHSWQHSPFVAGSNSNVMGMNPKSYFRGTQEGIGATAHWNLLMRAGGPFQVPGDYLYRDFSSFGQYKGGWGIVRVNDADAPPPPVADPELLVITAATATLRNNGRYNYSVTGTTNIVANNTVTVFVRDNSDDYVSLGTVTPNASGAWTLSVNNSSIIPQDPLQVRAISSGGETVIFP